MTMDEPSVESGVGTLVWVRRRNGSWWPGRILAPEELPGSHLLSPRSGTPVKLLGREDASVDWYNIEKSKRVKAFRCGEFDDCIERAKSFAGLPTKKREKYARREDAILHALELEKQQIELKELCGLFPDKRRSVDNTNEGSRGLEDDGCGQELLDSSSYEVPKSAADATQPAVSVPRICLENFVGSMLPPRKQKLDSSDWEDDTIEATPRMRGLQDFGLRIAPLKRKKSNWSNSFEDSLKDCLLEGDTKANSYFSKSMGVGIISNLSKGSNFAVKRKRSDVGPSPEESACKRRDRRRPLMQVLESSAKLPNVGFHDLQSGSKEILLGSVQMEDECLVALPHQARQIDGKVEQFTELDGLESDSGREGFILQHACGDACVSKQDSFDTASIVDKACSSFSNHINASCCDGRSMHFPSQLQATPLRGPVFVDSLLRASHASTCSLLSASAYTGSATSVNDNGLDKSSSISMPSVENLPYSTNLQLLCNNSIKEAVCNRSVNGLGMAQSTEETQPLSSCLPFAVNSVLRKSNLPMCSYSRKQEDYRTSFLKRGANILENLSIPWGSHSSPDLVKPKKSFLSQCPSSAVENLRSYTVGEDEAESFQVPAGMPTLPAIQMEGILKSSCLEQFEPVLAVVSPGRNEGRDETGFCNLVNRGSSVCQATCKVEDLSVSKWQAKGRRNARVPGKRAYEHLYRSSFTSSLEELEQSQDESIKHISWRSRFEKNGASSRANYVFPVVTEQQRQILSDNDGAAVMADLPDVLPHGKWECESVSFPSVPKFHDSSKSSFDGEDILYGMVVEPMPLQGGLGVGQLGRHETNAVQQWRDWFDVQVVVQANYQREHVPLVSLRSKLNGKAIVGYPVIVESVENRYSIDHIGCNRLKTSNGGKTKKSTLPPMWKTARRTAMLRVPRPCSTSVSSHDCASGIQTSLKRTLPKLGFMGFLSHNRRPMTKGHSLRYSTSGKKLSKRILKRAGLTSQKTRTLSSIAVCQNERHECTESASCPNLTQPPSMTCIPVSLVFSRIKEVLYGKSEPTILDDDRCLANALEKQVPS